jgi:urease accessory protein
MATTTEVPLHAWLALLLQTADPLFPTGAYAHSFGLEEAVRLGVVKDEASLETFLRRQIIPGLERLELPFLRRAHEAAVAEDLETLLALNAELDAWKPALELRRASRQIGARRVRMLLKIAPTPLLKRVAAAAGDSIHHMIACALQGAGAPVDAVLTAYFYQTLAGYCSAAPKLIRIGQEGCQRVLSAALARSGEALQTARGVAVEKTGWFDPVLEIAAMRHEHAFERLFIS